LNPNVVFLVEFGAQRQLLRLMCKMGACGVIHTYVAKMGRGKRMELIEIDVANVTQSKNGTFLDTHMTTSSFLGQQTTASFWPLPVATKYK